MENKFEKFKNRNLPKAQLWKSSINKPIIPDLFSNEEKESLTSPNEDYKTSNSTLSNKIIIQTIDSIYIALNQAPKYFFRIRILLFISFVINSCFLWMLLMMVAPVKNNTYCFDVFSREFKICQEVEYCIYSQSGISHNIFTDNSTISSQSVLDELIHLNNYYKDFYIKNKAIFTFLNSKVDNIQEMNNFYTVVVVITSKERFNLFNAFYVVCDHVLITVQVLVICFVSMAIGNVLYGFLADIYGRKPVLVITLMKQFIGCIMLFLYTAWIMSYADNTGNFIVFPRPINIAKLQVDASITSFIADEYIQAYDSDNLNVFYKDNFITYMNYNYEAERVSAEFNKYKFVFFISLFMIFSPCSSSYNISLSYILENCLNDSMTYSNYLFFHMAIPLSIVLQFILMTFCNNFQLPFLILGVILLLICILFAIIGYESPRHNFEFSSYEEITNFFEKIAPSEKLEKLYRPLKEKHSIKIQKEKNRISRENKSRVIFLYKIFCREIFFDNYSARKKYYKSKLNVNDMDGINRTEFLKFPSLIWFLIAKNKFINQNNLIIISLVTCVGFIFSLTLNYLNTQLLFSRSDLYENYIGNMPYFYIAVIMALSMWVFNIILKFLGYKTILFSCFLMIGVFSLIFEMICLTPKIPEDDNVFTLNSKLVLYDLRRSSLTGIICIIFFFVTALYTYLNIFLIKLSRTLYRCTFLGLTKAIIDFTIFFSFGFTHHFDKNFIFVAILCVIGFIISYFIKEDFGFTIISDFRKLEFADEE